MKYPIAIAKKFINNSASNEETKTVIQFDFNCRIINIMNVLSPNSAININYEYNPTTLLPTKTYGISNGNYYEYETYQKDISKIKKQYSGTKNQKVRKQKVFEYINNLDGTKTQKIVLFKLLGGYSIKEYKNSLYSAINNLNATAKEKTEIWNTLF